MTQAQSSPATHVRSLVIAFVLAVLAIPASAVLAAPPALRSISTPHGFAELYERLERSVEANGMAVVAAASASRGAAARGVTIPGNAVVMVFRNDYAVRMLEASVPAGIEAPLRFYITEGKDGTATLAWLAPSAVFAPYGSTALDAMARELDAIFDAIAHDAAR